MQFDLQKELGLGTPQTKPAFPWLPVIAGLCCVNFLMVIITLFVALRKPDPLLVTREQQPPAPNIVAVSSQLFAYTDQRIDQLETSIRDVNLALKQSRRTLTSVEADQRISDKRDRRNERSLEKTGLTNQDVLSAISALNAARLPVEPLLPDEQASFDQLIDQDDSGQQVIAFVAAQTNPAERAAYMDSLQTKGNRWFDSAMTAIRQQDPDAPYYIDNTLYFYDIVSDLSTDTAAVALIEARKNQLNLARQNQDLQEDVRLVEQKHDQSFSELEEQLKPRLSPEEAERERLNQRRENAGIEVYRPSGLVKEYETDWDQNPRVREEKGQGSSTPWSDINR